MKLISLNIEHNLHDKLVLPFLKKEHADVICIQELLEEKVDLYKMELGLDGAYQLLDCCRESSKSGHHPELIGKGQGVAIFAKHIIASGGTFIWGDNVALVWADVKNNNGSIIKIITTHLPVTKNGAVTPLQLQIVDSLLEKLSSFGEFVLCGDFNAPRGREAFSRIAKQYKDTIPAEYTTSIDQNLHRVKGLQYMVDGLFTTPGRKTSRVKLVDGVSDHMAIVAEIN